MRRHLLRFAQALLYGVLIVAAAALGVVLLMGWLWVTNWLSDSVGGWAAAIFVGLSISTGVGYVLIGLTEA